MALDFPWPAAWPDIILTAPDEAYEPEVADPSPPTGHALSSHDLPGARAVVDAGFAAAGVEPRASLEIEEFDGAAINTGARVALNATTAAWLLNLARLALSAAPPVDPADDVVAQTLPEWEESSGQVHGARVEVLHRLLWLIRMQRSDDQADSSRAGPAAVAGVRPMDRAGRKAGG